MLDPKVLLPFPFENEKLFGQFSSLPVDQHNHPFNADANEWNRQVFQDGM